MDTQNLCAKAPNPLLKLIGSILLLVYAALALLGTIASLFSNITQSSYYPKAIHMLLTFFGVTAALLTVGAIALLAILLLFKKPNAMLCGISAVVLLFTLGEISVQFFRSAVLPNLAHFSAIGLLLDPLKFFLLEGAILSRFLVLLFFTLLLFAFTTKKLPQKLLFFALCASIVLALLARPISGVWSLFIASGFSGGMLQLLLDVILGGFGDLVLCAGLLLCGASLVNPFKKRAPILS